MNKSDDKILLNSHTQSHKTNMDNKINSTNYLLEDSFDISNTRSKNPYTISAIHNKFNNTQNLLHDKTSILLENNSRSNISRPYDSKKEKSEESDIEESFTLEEPESRIKKKSEKKNITTEQENESKYLGLGLDSSLLSLSEESISIKKDHLTYNSYGKNKTENSINLPFTFNPELIIDKTTFNFGICLPGEIIKNTFKIKNKSLNEKTVVEVKVCSEVNIEKYFNNIPSLSNPSNNNNTSTFRMENSVIKYNCFNLFDNKSENENILEKKFLLKELEESEINIYFKSPFVKNKEDLFGLIQIYNNNILVSNIPILCSIEIPKLLCLKQITNSESKLPFINIMLELKSKGQKFRIPFKNASIKDMEVEFSIDKKNNNSVCLLEDNHYECQFFIFPNILSMSAGSSSSIELIAKIKRIRINENINQYKISARVRKVIIAKIKNSDVYYSFFVEAHLKNN